jgi:hypothetical protein
MFWLWRSNRGSYLAFSSYLPCIAPVSKIVPKGARACAPVA